MNPLASTRLQPSEASLSAAASMHHPRGFADVAQI
jgi:hypothetical protein